MENQFYRNAGLALIIGSIMMLATMILHPVGGNIDHIIKISQIIIVSHSLAIASIPISLFGFWGLTKKLGSTNIFSLTAFITIVMGFFAAMMSAAVNGLALPFFLEDYAESTPQTLVTIQRILDYNFAVNKATTMIYIAASCMSVLFWSIAIMRDTAFPKWIGYFGILLGSSAVILLVSGFVFNDLHGLRIFVFSTVTWVLVIGYLMRKRIKESGKVN